MNERLTIQNLVDLLVSRHGVPQKDADVFVREFFLLIEQALENDQYVKIKGLGTFKLIGVNSRESVNINTGERIKIEGHTKISFTPDPSLRDIINRPFSHFETVVLNENTVLEDTPIEELEGDPVDVPGVEGVQFMEDVSGKKQIETEPIEAAEQIETVESEGMPEQSTENAETTTGDIEEDTKKTENIEIGGRMVDVPEEVEKETCKDTGTKTIIEIEGLSVDEVSEDIKPDKTDEGFEEEQEQAEKEIEEGEAPKLTAEEIIAREIQKTEVPIVPMRKERHPQKEIKFKKEKSPVPYLVTIIAVVMLLCGAALVFVYYPDLFSKKESEQSITTETVEKKEPIREIPLDTVAKADTIVKVVAKTPNQQEIKQMSERVNVSEKVDKTSESESVSREKSTKTVAIPVKPDSVNYTITGTKATYTIKEGETLTRVSLRFYGTKDLWPYIVKHNRGVIKNPNNVPYGTVLKIPELVKK